MRERIREHVMLDGVTLSDPATTFIDADVQIGEDTVILPNTYLEGKTRIGQDCRIGPNAILRDAVIGNGCIGLIAGFVAQWVMHLHMTLLWTAVLGLAASILGGFITHLFDRPKPEANYHPAGIIVSILFALLVLWLLSKVPIFSVDQI